MTYICLLEFCTMICQKPNKRREASISVFCTKIAISFSLQCQTVYSLIANVTHALCLVIGLKFREFLWPRIFGGSDLIFSSLDTSFSLRSIFPVFASARPPRSLLSPSQLTVVTKASVLRSLSAQMHS